MYLPTRIFPFSVEAHGEDDHRDPSFPSSKLGLRFSLKGSFAESRLSSHAFWDVGLEEAVGQREAQ